MNLLALPAIASTGYHVFALFAGLRKLRDAPVPEGFLPPVSILKPVHGTDARFASSIASHALQDYPEFEILFGISNPADSARPEIERLIALYPGIPIRCIVVSTDAPNTKTGVLAALAREARHAILLVNDGDISVEPGYLRETVAPLADDAIGLVTCLYRAAGGTFATRSESLGIATEFAPSVLVARQIGVNEFAMGSTLVFQAGDLARIGGFDAMRDFLADDYQLGKRITSLGKAIALARPVVTTWLGSGSWRDVWKHQVRWSRTIRVSRKGGYFGYGITLTALWCLLAACTGSAWTALACYLVRCVSGLLIAGLVLKDRASLKLWWWMPGRDLFGAAVWIAGLFGDQVEWRGKRLKIDPSGRIL